MIRRASALVFILVLLAGCASLDVDRTATGFDDEAYFSDLHECQGGR
ncbi:MAG: hypothetical protein O3B21_12805 [Proteobacteria bacterium]|nr:hypothetical protein [Pseudomonadota bacterium]